MKLLCPLRIKQSLQFALSILIRQSKLEGRSQVEEALSAMLLLLLLHVASKWVASRSPRCLRTFVRPAAARVGYTASLREVVVKVMRT